LGAVDPHHVHPFIARLELGGAESHNVAGRLHPGGTQAADAVDSILLLDLEAVENLAGTVG
jgi:hypothetical protein